MGVGLPDFSEEDRKREKERVYIGGGGIFSGDVYDDSGKRIGRMESDCFVATACSRAMGLSDDCPQLELLREYRESYLKNVLGGHLIIRVYYLIGPRIVAAINKRQDSKKIYLKLYNSLVLKSLELIREGRNKEALRNGLGQVSKLVLNYSLAK